MNRGHSATTASPQDASRFIDVCYEMKWVNLRFDWGAWMNSLQALRLRDDPAALESATPDQLQNLLTVVIRQDRFVEGALATGFESGLLVRILRRAAVLAEETQLEGSDDPGLIWIRVFPPVLVRIQSAS